MELVQYSAMEIPSKNFWPKVEKTRGCWKWKAATTSKGYGIFGFWDPIQKKRHNEYAHRVALILEGHDLVGKHVHHLCGNRACVNPVHLEVLTPRAHGKKRRTPHGLVHQGKGGAWIFQRRFDTKEEAEAFKRFGKVFNRV